MATQVVESGGLFVESRRLPGRDAPGRNAQPSTHNLQLAKRQRAKKLRKPLGPFETSCTHFDAGTRPIEIVRLTAAGITYRLKGRHEEYTITHGTAFQRAACAAAGFDAGPRDGKRITRGTV